MSDIVAGTGVLEQGIKEALEITDNFVNDLIKRGYPIHEQAFPMRCLENQRVILAALSHLIQQRK
jgi:hypothetical protein